MKPQRGAVTSDQLAGRGRREAFSEDLAAVASLDEPTRRRIYEHVSFEASPVSRDDVAQALGIPRRTAAAHCDRLAELGLLSVSFARRTGRNGPGAGRPAKLYRRSGLEVAVSLPPRHYDLAGSLLAGAVAAAQLSGEPPRAVLDRHSYDVGRAMGREQSGQREPDRPDIPGDTGDLMSLLRAQGFEPTLAGGDIIMHNCPFHALAVEHAEPVCGMNLHLVEGILEGLGLSGVPRVPGAKGAKGATGATGVPGDTGATGVTARLDPGPSRCCVRLEIHPRPA